MSYVKNKLTDKDIYVNSGNIQHICVVSVTDWTNGARDLFTWLARPHITHYRNIKYFVK